MNPFKIRKRLKLIKELELKIIKTESSIEEIHISFLKPYRKQKALEMDRYCHLLHVYKKALQKIYKL